MALLVTGLVLFFGVHLFTALAREGRASLIRRMGAMPYKGAYSIVSLAGFVLIILGWRAAGPGTLLWSPAPWAWPVAYVLMVLAFILLTAAYLPAGRIKAAVGHPMVTGTILFGLAHLLVNGDVRSALLFGSFLAYGLLDRLAVHQRGETGPASGQLAWDGAAVLGGLGGAFLVVSYLHPYIAGVALRPEQAFGG